MAQETETLTPEDEKDLEATAELMVHTKLVTDHLALVVQDIRRETGIQGLPIFVGLLAVALQEASLMLSTPTVDTLDKKVFLATQLAQRLLTTGDAVLSMVPQPEETK